MSWEDVLNRFLRQVQEDLTQHRERDLQEYQQLFPEEFATRIEAEYRTLAEDEGEGQPGSIGPYRVVRLIGHGGQGRVFLTEDSVLRRRVAVKVLTSLGGCTSDQVRRFLREAEAASRVDHSGICTVYETGTDGGLPYLAMQFLEGQTLAQQIAETPPEVIATPAAVTRSCQLITQVLDALEAAHERDVVHRDIKPGNLMIQPDGRPVILDFGLARIMESERSVLTRTGDFLGTPAYMAPEQLSEHPRPVDRRTDLYATAATLYELLTGRPPFQGASPMALVQAIESRPPPDPRNFNPAVSTELVTVLEKALQKDPTHRYATAREFADELRRMQAGEPVTARRPGPMLRTWRWSQRNPVLASMFGALALTLVVGLVVSTVLLVLRGQALQDARSKGQLADQRLTRVLRLSALDEVETLLELEGSLWPAAPEQETAIAAWLDRAQTLLQDLPDYQEELTRLRATALPYDEDQRQQDRARHPLAGELQQLMGHLEVHERSQPCHRVLEDPDRLEEHVADLRRQRDAIERELNAARSYTFADPTRQWEHDQLRRLIDRIEGLAEEDEHGATFVALERRLEDASSLKRRTYDEHEDAWEDAMLSVSDEELYPQYAGLSLEPQMGLVPLGPDPASDLWEFWHIPTGARPERDDQDRLVVEEGTGLVFVLVPAGTVQMGAQAEDPTGPRYFPRAFFDESPLVEIDLEPFFLSKYEMTQAQWQRATGNNPSFYHPGRQGNPAEVTGRHPVESVSFPDVRRVLRQLGLTLSTEAQWEYAARGGTDTLYWFGDTLRGIGQRVNLADRSLASFGFVGPHVNSGLDDGHAIHAPVDSYLANPFGLHCVLGNVQEWCLDRNGLYQLPTLPGTGERLVFEERTRAVRGGSFNNSADYVRSASRESVPDSDRDPTLGVRPARPLVSGAWRGAR